MFWTQDLYSLNNWHAGHCHTYNPPKELPPGVHGQFYALLGNLKKEIDPKLFNGFYIFLHDRGQFWPGKDLKRIGMSKVLNLRRDMEWSGVFEMKQKTLISKETSKCEEDANYSFTNCIFSWVSKTAGCQLGFLSTSPLKEDECTTKNDILRYSVSLLDECFLICCF